MLKTFFSFCLPGNKTSLNHKRIHEDLISRIQKKIILSWGYPFVAKYCSRFVRLFNLLYNDLFLQKFKEHLFLKNYNWGKAKASWVMTLNFQKFLNFLLLKFCLENLNSLRKTIFQTWDNDKSTRGQQNEHKNSTLLSQTVNFLIKTT
jgi:hypothetical protein